MKKYIFILLGLSTFMACSPSLKVTSDYDKAVSFQPYKTFAINTVDSSKQAISQLNEDRIINAIKSELSKKGFTENTASPDLLVHAVTVLKDRKSVSSNTDYYGYGGGYRPWGWGGGMGVTGYTTYNVQDYKDGSLIIDIADAKTQKLVWEGIGNKEIDKPLDNPDAEIAAAVASILAKFPPGAVAK